MISEIPPAAKANLSKWSGDLLGEMRKRNRKDEEGGGMHQPLQKSSVPADGASSGQPATPTVSQAPLAKKSSAGKVSMEPVSVDQVWVWKKPTSRTS